jgi:hypothetical protein
VHVGLGIGLGIGIPVLLLLALVFLNLRRRDSRAAKSGPQQNTYGVMHQQTQELNNDGRPLELYNDGRTPELSTTDRMMPELPATKERVKDRYMRGNIR